MQIVHSIEQLRAVHAQLVRQHKKIAFVPTMGNLHEGHIALVGLARQSADVVFSSIFVNRLQFLPHEDFNSYPRTFERDCEQLRAANCDLLFAPTESVLYPQAQTVKVAPDPALGDILEGQFRPGFFTGVCTVVAKLFACVQPNVAVFGKKDYQQLAVIRQMVSQLAMPIDIVAAQTTRASDGLALSSRNGYLSVEQRQQAPQLNRALQDLANKINIKALDLNQLEFDASKALQALGWQVDYLTVRQRKNLLPPDNAFAERGALVVMGAAKLGATRLIDNIEF